MVWVEIWERKYNSKYDYVSIDLINRFREKFDNVIRFLTDHHLGIEEISVQDRWTSPRVRIQLNLLSVRCSDDAMGTSIMFNCTTKQLKSFEETAESENWGIEYER